MMDDFETPADRAQVVFERHRSLRLEFIKAAMQGLCASIEYGAGHLINGDEIAQDAVFIADRTISAAEKGF